MLAEDPCQTENPYLRQAMTYSEIDKFRQTQNAEVKALKQVSKKLSRTGPSCCKKLSGLPCAAGNAQMTGTWPVS